MKSDEKGISLPHLYTHTHTHVYKCMYTFTTNFIPLCALHLLEDKPTILCSLWFTFRWDIQRARALREHEELLRKYRMKAGQSQEKKKEKVTTLLPNMSESKLCEM